jgi:hypothetical protein
MQVSICTLFFVIFGLFTTYIGSSLNKRFSWGGHWALMLEIYVSPKIGIFLKNGAKNFKKFTFTIGYEQWNYWGYNKDRMWETRECYPQFRINIGCPARVLLPDSKISKFFTKSHPTLVDDIFAILDGKVSWPQYPCAYCLPVCIFSTREGNVVDEVA